MTNEQTALLLDSIIGELYGSIRDVEESLPDECFEDQAQFIGSPVRVCRHTRPLHDVREWLELRRDSLLNKS